MLGRISGILVNQRSNIEDLINREAGYLAMLVNRGSIISADSQLDRLGGVLAAAFYSDIITNEEYEYLFRACMAIRYGKECIA